MLTNSASSQNRSWILSQIDQESAALLGLGTPQMEGPPTQREKEIRIWQKIAHFFLV